MNRMRQEILQAALATPCITADQGRQSFCFPQEFIGFGGHFPGYPILPAILQTLLAQLLAEQVIGETLHFKSLTRAKFTRQLRPGEQIDVAINCLEKEGQLRCATQLKVKGEQAASFILVLTKGEQE